MAAGGTREATSDDEVPHDVAEDAFSEESSGWSLNNPDAVQASTSQQAAADVIHKAANRIGAHPEGVLSKLAEAQIMYDWQLRELVPEDWNQLGASLGLVSAVRHVLAETRENQQPAAATSSSTSRKKMSMPVKNLDTGEYVSRHQMSHMLSQLSVTQLSSADSANASFDEDLAWPTPREKVERPSTRRMSKEDDWQAYEVAQMTFHEMSDIVKRAQSKAKDKRVSHDAHSILELMQMLEGSGVVIVADWPTRLLMHEIRELIATLIFGKSKMPSHGVLFLHRSDHFRPRKTLPQHEFVCTYIDSMMINATFADRDLSASYVAYKRFKELHPWATHANIKTELASADVWVVI
ncbi:hypothetical protein AB1Y20_005226 [Prymnesium parvum]|uniref:Uncharacterized protein n=1 Tax=Prymnesium parvum TaxID=97485 RepID=A0AB34J4S0_PRYPA